MTGFINPNSIKHNESSDHTKVIYSHLVPRWSEAGNTGYTFSLMKLAERVICGVAANRE